MLPKMVRPDSKGRILLGARTRGISGYAVSETSDHKIILEPYTEIPAKEKWLFNNKVALKKVKQGLKDAAVGKLIDQGSFAKYATDDQEELE